MLYIELLLFLLCQSPLPCRLVVDAWWWWCMLCFRFWKEVGFICTRITCRPKIKTNIKNHRSQKRKLIGKKKDMYIKRQKNMSKLGAKIRNAGKYRRQSYFYIFVLYPSLTHSYIIVFITNWVYHKYWLLSIVFDDEL